MHRNSEIQRTPAIITPPQEDWHNTQRQESAPNLTYDLFFALDSAKLESGVSNVLDEFSAAAFEQSNILVVIEGHTDTSGTWEHNQHLAEARIRAVSTGLIRRGVPRDCIRGNLREGWFTLGTV